MKHNRAFYMILILALVPAWIVGGRVSGTALAANQDVNSQPVSLAAIGGPVGQDPTHWSLTFNDEFDGTSLNTSVWRQDYWNGGNGELQEYVNDNSHGNYNVQNGILSLTARKESYNGKSYTSGIITTQSRFAQTYGYFEMRAQLPYGKGLWPAFWLMPDPSGWPPEIDVMENLGNNTVYMTLHPTSGSQSQGYYSTDVSANYHTYGIDWQPGYIIWSIDGIERFRVSDTSKIPNIPMFILANLAVGGSWPGSPDASTVFPASYNIDYIRVWKYVSAPAPTATPTQTTLPTPTATPTQPPPQPTATTAPTTTTAPTATAAPTQTPPPTQQPVSSKNMLINSSFERKGSSWYSPWSLRNDLGATISQDTKNRVDGSRSFKATLPQANSSQPWAVSLMQMNLSLVAGRTYTLSFYSDADVARSLKVIVQLADSPFTEFFNATANVSADWGLFSYSCTAPSTTSSAMVNFNLATQTGKVWLDQILFCEGASACTP